MSSFDPSSGLVYRETTSALVRSMVPTWMDHSTGRKIDPVTYRNPAKGSSSLQEMVLRQCMWNIDRFEPEALQFLDWHYASRIYERLKKNNTLTFNAWDLFRKAFPAKIDRLHHFYIPEDVFSPVGSVIRPYVNPPSQLPSVVNRLAKFDTTPLTYLWLQGYRITANDLMTIIQIPTLAVLSLYHPPCPATSKGLDERDLKNWGRAVHEASAFKQLKVLILRGFPLSEQSVFLAIAKFPALKLLGISRDPSTADTREEPPGNWRPLPHESPLKSDASTPEGDPQTIYNNCRLPIGGRMDLLHSLSKRFPRHGLEHIDTDLAVSIGHTGWDMKTAVDNPTWYFRDADPGDKMVMTTKRSFNSQDSMPASENSALKKRAVRRVKQKDLSSLLSSFS